jgi:hypothetical protein
LNLKKNPSDWAGPTRQHLSSDRTRHLPTTPPMLLLRPQLFPGAQGFHRSPTCATALMAHTWTGWRTPLHFHFLAHPTLRPLTHALLCRLPCHPLIIAGHIHAPHRQTELVNHTTVIPLWCSNSAKLKLTITDPRAPSAMRSSSMPATLHHSPIEPTTPQASSTQRLGPVTSHSSPRHVHHHHPPSLVSPSSSFVPNWPPNPWASSVAPPSPTTRRRPTGSD